MLTATLSFFGTNKIERAQDGKQAILRQRRKINRKVTYGSRN